MPALQVKYRPKSLKGFFGNKALKEGLSKVIQKEDKPTSYLFTGPSGCGKTTLGRVLGAELKIDPLNMNIYNASSDRGIASIREMIEKSKKEPILGGVQRMFVLEECHGITGQAAEALLDFLEHPPANVFIVLTTTEPDALKVTIKRRCWQGEVKPLPDDKMLKLIENILSREKESVQDSIIQKIVKSSNGSAGQALKLLDMVIGVNPTEAEELIQDIYVSETEVIELCRLLMRKMDSTKKWGEAQKMLKTLTGEPESNRRVIQAYFNSVIVSKPYGDELEFIADKAAMFTEPFFHNGKLGLTLAVLACC